MVGFYDARSHHARSQETKTVYTIIAIDLGVLCSGFSLEGLMSKIRFLTFQISIVGMRMVAFISSLHRCHTFRLKDTKKQKKGRYIR